MRQHILFPHNTHNPTAWCTLRVGRLRQILVLADFD